jgi:hypothetical protein
MQFEQAKNLIINVFIQTRKTTCTKITALFYRTSNDATSVKEDSFWCEIEAAVAQTYILYNWHGVVMASKVESTHYSSIIHADSLRYEMQFIYCVSV